MAVVGSQDCVVETAAPDNRIGVVIAGGDPLSRAGLTSHLRLEHDLRVSDKRDATAVGLVLTDGIDEDALRAVRTLHTEGIRRIVLLVTRIDDAGLLAAIEAGVTGIIRREEATGKAVAGAVRAAAANEGSLPPDVLARLLDQVGQLQRRVLNPRGLTFAGLTEREIEVMRLLAEGLDTSEVGRRLYFSERTVKNIVHDVTSRLELRNRTQAVAYAIRQGLI
jgi:DNA-binding NarL/FixJ family response regulator